MKIIKGSITLEKGEELTHKDCENCKTITIHLITEDRKLKCIFCTDEIQHQIKSEINNG